MERKIYLKNKVRARIFQKNFNKKHGYRPSLFIKLSPSGKKTYFIIKPKGLRRI